MNGPTGLASRDMVAINYDIPKELHHRIKVLAVLQGKTVKAVLIEALEEKAERMEKETDR